MEVTAAADPSPVGEAAATTFIVKVARERERSDGEPLGSRYLPGRRGGGRCSSGCSVRLWAWFRPYGSDPRWYGPWCGRHLDAAGPLLASERDENPRPHNRVVSARSARRMQRRRW